MSSLYVSDLDGTLLRNDGTLSYESRSALQQLLADGLVFSFASARSEISMRPMLKGLHFTLPVIEFNGAFVSDLTTGRHEFINAIDPELAREIYELFHRFARSPFVSTFNGETDCVYFCEATNGGERQYLANRLENNDDRLRHTHDLAAALRDQVVCFTVIAEAEPLSELEIAIRERYGDQVEINSFENRYSPRLVLVDDPRSACHQGSRHSSNDG